MKKDKTITIQPTKIFYRAHDNKHVRVWRETWAGDQFEIIDRDEFRAFGSMLVKFGLSDMLEQAEDDTDYPWDFVV